MTGLCTDMYEVRMAASYLHRAMAGPATFLDAASLAALRDTTFTGDVRAVPEGRLVFADEPLLPGTGPHHPPLRALTAQLRAAFGVQAHGRAGTAPAGQESP